MPTTVQTYEARRWGALVLLCFAQFIVVLDASIVNVALPSIGADLSFSQDELSWVLNAYVLTFGGFLLLGGRLADLFGRRRVFIAGLLLVAAASLAAGFAADAGQLIAARAAQGLGAAIISPAALSLITTIFRDGAELNKALGAWGAVAGSAGAVGVLLGGVLTDALSWEWVMWVNVPVALVVAALTPRMVAPAAPASDTRRIDVAGATTVTAGFSVMVFAVVDASDAGWASTQTLGLLALSAALLAGFVAIERSAAAPLVPLRIFRMPLLRGANVVGLLVGGTLIAMFFFITLYLQQVLDLSPIETGFAYLPLSVAIVIVSGVASQLVTKVGVMPVLATGMGFVAVALLWFSQISVGGGYLTDVLGPSVLAGAGLGLAFVPVTIAAVSGVPPQDAGLASGLINTALQIGGALGLALLAALANSRTDDLVASDGAAGGGLVNALNEGFQVAFLAGAALAALGVVLTLVLLRDREQTGGSSTEAAPAEASG